MDVVSSHRSVHSVGNDHEKTLDVTIMSQQTPIPSGNILPIRPRPSQRPSFLARLSHTSGNFDVKVIAPMNLDKFNRDCLEAHNDYRRAHYAPALRLNDHLRIHAQSLADELARRDSLEHRPDADFGTNVYACVGFEPTGFRTAQRWYQEKNAYDFDAPGFSTATGHFTQMLWRKTSRMGVGVARANNGNYYVVANYEPPGNVVNQYRENVLDCDAKHQPEELTKRKFVDVVRSLFTRPFNQFQKECLEAHNVLRARHGSPPLRLGVEICRHAQEWAQTLAADNEMRSRGYVRFGENIFSIHATHVHGSLPVRMWYAESALYDGTYAAETGHFTQIIWATSVELGVGVARSQTNDVYVVANYFPPGNIANENDRNILRWCKHV